MQGKWEEHDRKIASLEEKVEKLEEENQMMKTYLCSKDPQATFCL